VWDRYGSIAGDNKAHREAAKVAARRQIHRRDLPAVDRTRLYALLKRDDGTEGPLLRRWMRKHWHRGHNHTTNQIIIRSDKARTFASSCRGKNPNRRLTVWTKGVTAEALKNGSGRGGSAVRLVNAAYTSQVIPGTNSFGRRVGDRLHRTGCGYVWQADHAAAINIPNRAADPDIGRWTPHWRVKQIIQERDRQRSRLPDQDSNTTGERECGERTIRSRSTRATQRKQGCVHGSR